MSKAHQAPDTVSTQVLGSILNEIGVGECLQAFVNDDRGDDCLKTLSKFNAEKIASKYGLPLYKAAEFAEKCRSITSTFGPLPPPITFAALSEEPPSPIHDRTTNEPWLKACLILQACVKGVRPFVSSVMKRLLERTNEIVKEGIQRELGTCQDEEWDCRTCSDASDKNFTEDGPVTLRISSMDANGVAECETPHDLKHYVLRPCRLTKIPVGCFAFSDTVTSDVPLLICRNPADVKDPSTSVLLLHKLSFDSSKPFLSPFRVRRCVPSDPEHKFYAVLCPSVPGRTAELVKSFLAQASPSSTNMASPLSDIDDRKSFHFWSLKKGNAVYSECKHPFKTGDILCFDGGEESSLPHFIKEGHRYLVTHETSNFSFSVCGPIICPISPFNSESSTCDEKQLVVVRRSPIGR
jgi:hypothetical protein